MTQKNRTDVLNSINTNIPDNNDNLVTPERVRTAMVDILDSAYNILSDTGVRPQNVFVASDDTGVTDVTQELEDYVLTLDPGSPVFIPDGTYRINNFDPDIAAWTLWGNKGGAIFEYDAPTPCISVNQSVKTGKPIPVAITAITDVLTPYDSRGTRISVADASQFASGDRVAVFSNDSGGYGYSWLIGEGAIVSGVDTVSDYIYLDRVLRFQSKYVTTPKICKYHEGQSYSMTGITVRAGGNYMDKSILTRNDMAVIFRGVQNVTIDNCKIHETWGGGLKLLSVNGGLISNSQLEDHPDMLLDDAVTRVYGYGIWYTGMCTDIVAYNCEGHRSRHFTTSSARTGGTFNQFDWYSDGIPTHISNNNLYGAGTAGSVYDTHEGGYNIEFNDCSAILPSTNSDGGNSDATGIYIRSMDTRINNFKQLGGKNGIRFANTNFGEKIFHSVNGAVIKDLKTGDAPGTAVTVDNQTGISEANKNEIIVSNLQVTNCPRGVSVRENANLKLNSAEITNTATAIKTETGSKLEYGDISMDFDSCQISGTLYAIDVSADAGATSKVTGDTIKIKRGNTTSRPESLFYSSANTGTKEYFVANLIEDNPSDLAAMPLTTNYSSFVESEKIYKRNSPRNMKKITTSPYTLTNRDFQKGYRRFSSGTDIQVILPSNGPINSHVKIHNDGAGYIILIPQINDDVNGAPEGGATIVNRNDHNLIPPQGAVAELYIFENNSQTNAAYLLTGDTIATPVELWDFETLNAIPSNFTVTRSDGGLSTLRNSSGELILGTANTARFNHDVNGVRFGLMLEPRSVNVCTNYNAIPDAGLTGMTVSGGMTFARVADATALGNAKLVSVVTGNVFEAINATGSSQTVIISGDIGAIGTCCASMYARIVAGPAASFGITPTPTTMTVTGAAYALYEANTLTSTATTDKFTITVPNGTTIRFILNQLETGSLCKSVVKTSGASATRPLELVQDTSVLTRSWFNLAQGSIVATPVFKYDSNITTEQYAFMLSADDNTTNAMGLNMATTSTKCGANVRANSTTQPSAFNNMKQGFKRLQEFPCGVSWVNGRHVQAFCSTYKTESNYATSFLTMNKLTLGGRTSSQTMIGHLKNVRVFKYYKPHNQLGAYLAKSTYGAIAVGGQSNAEGYFDTQSSHLNSGMKASIETQNLYWPTTANFMLSGATSGSEALKNNPTPNNDGWWYDIVSGEFGPGMRRWEYNVSIFMKNGGTVRGIVWDQGESDTGETEVNYYAALLAIFTRMWEVAGNVPVLITKLGRREESANDSNSSYANQVNLIRKVQEDLAAAYPTQIYITPEKFDQPIEDVNVHVSAAGMAVMGERVTRKLARVLGISVSGGVDGPTITGAVRVGTTVTVTIAHEAGATDFTPTSSIAGFKYFYNSGTTEKTVSTAARASATTIELTLADTSGMSGAVGTEILYYGYGAMYSVGSANYANLVKDNSAQTLPLKYKKLVI